MRALTKVNMVAFRIRIHILTKYSISILSFIKMYCQSMAYTETKSRAYKIEVNQDISIRKTNMHVF